MSALTDLPAVLVPLSRAVLCANCDLVSIPSKHGRCAGCGSDAVFKLSHVFSEERPAQQDWIMDVLQAVREEFNA